MFKPATWNERPEDVRRIKGNRVVVTRNVDTTERDGQTVYVGEVAFMSESSYAAYVGAKEVAQRREQEIVDETVLNLIEEGSL